MFLFKVAPVLLIILAVGAEKKIELQDIEEDNLKSEKEKELDKEEGRHSTAPSGADTLMPLEFFKNGLLRYFQNQPPSQQPRYVQQYAVTEPPERPAPAPAVKPEYGAPAPQQAMVGYLSNVPMQIYLVPHYQNDPHYQNEQEQPTPQPVQYTQQVAPYPQDALQHNYIEVPAYVTPSGKAYLPPYQSQLYVTYAQPTVAAPQATVSPVIYQMPLVHYPIVAPSTPTHQYYQHYTETNSLNEGEENVEHPKQYQTDVPYKPTGPEYPRYYNSRVPIREQQHHGAISELPPPNPVLLKSPPAHLAHLPKTLPLYRPPKPVYAVGGNLLTSSYTPRPSEAYSASFKRRPTSLLDSYIPSSLQVEYLKRGYTKDAQSTYEALSSGRHYPIPRQYERGFLPNQMYHTAAGGITYGHYKRTPKGEKVQQK